MWRRDAFSGQESIEFLALFYLHVSCTNAGNANCLKIPVKMSSPYGYKKTDANGLLSIFGHFPGGGYSGKLHLLNVRHSFFEVAG